MRAEEVDVPGFVALTRAAVGSPGGSNIA